MSTMAELTEAYLAGVGELRAAIAGMTREQMLARPVPGKWSTLEVVAHLADFDPVYAERMKRVIALERPSFLEADETLFARSLAYHERDAEDELALMDLTRRQMVRTLRTLPDAALARVGVHTTRGERTLADLINGVIDHVRSHLPHIAEKRRALGV